MYKNHPSGTWFRFSAKTLSILLAAAVVFSAVFLLAGHAGATHGTYAGTGADINAGAADPLSARTVWLTGEEQVSPSRLPDGATVLICHDRREFSAVSQDETVSALLERVGVTPGPLDTVLVDCTQQPLKVTVEVDPTGCVETSEVIPAETVRVANPHMDMGQEQILQEGVDGLRIFSYEVVCFNGKELSRTLLAETVTSPSPQIIEYGTAVDTLDPDDRLEKVEETETGGILTFQSGATMKFSAVKKVTATAYTAGRGGAGYITASGTPARPGAVAVDRRVIPLGSKLYILTDDGRYIYGLAVAEDTGVIGDRVDLYYDDYDECIRFGRRAATIYILEE